MEEVAERFLQELISRRVAREFESDRTRFHRLVSTAAAYWLCHPRTTMKLHQTKHTMSLMFEGPVATKQVQIFCFRVHFPTQEYRFLGTVLEPSRSLPHGCAEVLERIRGLTAAYLGSGESSTAVSVVLKGERMPDLLPLVDETRRTLDGGSEVAVVPNQSVRKTTPAYKSSQTPRVTPARPTRAASALAPQKIEAQMDITAAATESPAAPVTEVAPFEAAALMLACPKPSDSAAFHSRVFQQKAVRKTRDRHYVELRLGSLLVAFQDDLTKEERKLYGYGPIERNRGWGAIFLVRVSDAEACLRRAKRIPGAVLREDKDSKTFVLRDPAGYLFEVGPIKT